MTNRSTERNRVLVMTSKVRPFLRKRVPQATLATAMLAGFALVLIPSTQATAASWHRVLNPQPLPPGIYAPYHQPSGARALNPQPLPPGIYAPYYAHSMR